MIGTYRQREQNTVEMCQSGDDLRRSLTPGFQNPGTPRIQGGRSILEMRQGPCRAPRMSMVLLGSSWLPVSYTLSVNI
jgi:hypothetical protein